MVAVKYMITARRPYADRNLEKGMGRQPVHSPTHSTTTAMERMKQMQYTAMHHLSAACWSYNTGLLTRMKITQATKVWHTFIKPGAVAM